MKILWTSRHNLNDEQLADLHKLYGDVEVLHHNITWEASENSDKDFEKNSALWSTLFSYIVNEDKWIIAGVFPPVALEALPDNKNLRIISPVSKQLPELRKGDGPIPYKHLRWATLH